MTLIKDLFLKFEAKSSKRLVNLTPDEKFLAISNLEKLPDVPKDLEWWDGRLGPEVFLYDKLGFSSIGFNKSSVIPATKKTDAQLMKDIRELKLAELYVAQPSVPRQGLLTYINDFPRDNELPIVKLVDGKLTILSGNTRCSVYKLAERLTIPCMYTEK